MDIRERIKKYGKIGETIIGDKIQIIFHIPNMNKFKFQLNLDTNPKSRYDVMLNMAASIVQKIYDDGPKLLKQCKKTIDFTVDEYIIFRFFTEDKRELSATNIGDIYYSNGSVTIKNPNNSHEIIEIEATIVKGQEAELKIYIYDKLDALDGTLVKEAMATA